MRHGRTMVADVLLAALGHAVSLISLHRENLDWAYLRRWAEYLVIADGVQET